MSFVQREGITYLELTFWACREQDCDKEIIKLEKFVITGGKPLHGEVIISGAKNAAVGILPATILAADVCVIENLPDISDVAVSLKILSVLGAKVRMLNKNTYEIDTTHLTGTNVPDDLSRQMRASYYFLGALLSRFGQNYPISAEGLGKEITIEHLAEIFLDLQKQGAHNINLVTPGQWRPWIIAALDIARTEGLRLPIVCNTGGYETVESVEAWRGSIDIWLADLKYVSSSLSAELSSAPDYFAQARPAIEAMMAQAGHPVFDSEGILQKGVILRHLALPGHIDDSFAVLDQMAAWNEADPGCFIPSVMSQYTPFYKAAEHGIGRRITTYEYRRVVNYAMDLGLTAGYMQQKSSAREEYTPSFDLTGV